MGFAWLVWLAGTSAHASMCSQYPWPVLACDGYLNITEIRSTDPAQTLTYGCTGNLQQPGPEWIFEFPCTVDGPVTVNLSNTGCDVDMYVLNGNCAPAVGCLDAGVQTSWGVGLQESVTFTCTVGQTRWIVLEGYDLAMNPSRCAWNGPSQNYRMTPAWVVASCAEQCTDGFDNDLDRLIDCDDPECTCAELCDVPGDEDGDGFADCNDGDCVGHPACCDQDGDGFAADTPACGGDDCDDLDGDVYVGAVDAPNDGVDQDCDGGDTCWVDADRDGFGGTSLITSPNLSCSGHPGIANDPDDCDDGVATIYPGAPEIPGDDVDQDCDGVDHCWRDRDRDDYGAGQAVPGPGLMCDAYAAWAARDGDCLDQGLGAEQAHPGGTEVCDGVDNDCDGLFDDDDPDIAGQVQLWPDGDGDGYGRNTGAILGGACEVPPGYAAFTGDCDDADPNRSPGAEEIPYDGVDQDCTGADLDDLDGDGYAGPMGVGADCNDNNPLVHPGRTEVFNGGDDDCDGAIDEGTNRYDDDGDGFTEASGDCNDADAGVNPAAVEVCDNRDQDCDGVRDDGTSCRDDDGDGFSEDAGDCHDGNPSIFPGATELPANGIDDDCDGVVDIAAVDEDGDGFATFGGDCDDTRADVSPVAAEVPDGVDNDCNGRVDEGTDRTDDDFDGFTEITGDCNDRDPNVWPGAPELPNNIDDDCNGRVDDAGDFGDADRDGWTIDGGDCDDDNRDVHPYAREIADGVDQDCDGQIDEGAVDVDGDGFTLDQGDCDDDEGWSNPEQVEVCDGIDNDCDGRVDEEACPAVVVVERRTCAHAGPPAPSVALGGLLGLMALLGRRRRA